MGFSSVVGLVEDLEHQIESLSLSQQSPAHTIHLQQTIAAQQDEIQRLSDIIENKSRQIFKLHQSQIEFKNKLELRLSKTQKINRQLRIRIGELEYLLTTDNSLTPKLDSHNSNLPPSLNLPWQKVKRTRSLRIKSGLQAGGQAGHQGFTLQQVSHPDFVIVHRVNVCQYCHHSLIQSESIRLNKRQIFEIEKGGLFVTEHRAEVKLCPLCRKISKANFPENLKAPVQYGSSVFSRIVYLNQYQLLPVARTAESMNDLFNCPVSPATIQRAAKVCNHQLFRFEYRLKAALRQAQVLGVDETGININGENNWVHVARTDNLTHLAFHSKRSGIAVEEIGIVNEFTGTLVRDGFASYRKYERCQHSLCNAHLLRDLTFVGEADPNSKSWTDSFAKLLIEIKDAVEIAKAGLLNRLDDSLRTNLLNRYDLILAAAEPAIRGSPQIKTNQLSAPSLHKRLVKNKTEILRFMTDFRVPFDNNGSERDLRMLKLQQKISGCFRTTSGATTFCRIRSYLSSVKKQGRGLLTAIELAVQGKPFALTN